MALWDVTGHAATVAQLVGADVGGLITMIMQAAMTAQQNKKECEQLARRVFTIAELLQHLQDPEVLRRSEIRRPLTGLDDTLREAHELVLSCQDKSAVYQLVMARRQADRFRDVQSRIDSYLLLFPVISHMDITRRLERIYNILLPNDTPGPSTPAFSVPQFPVPAAQVATKFVSREIHGVKEFTFKELATATNNFSPDRMIGQGGFATVYIGMLPDGREVAIKRTLETSDIMKTEFMTQLSILRSFSHEHIVRVFGCCVKEKRQLLPPFRKMQEEFLLVLEYMENGSLSSHLHGPRSSSLVMTSWKTRIEILLGVSRAIDYLLSYGERPVIHGDVKPSNILLDGNWAPRLSDFGIALTFERPGHEENIVGTFGYLAPECVIVGTLNPTVDVYSLGVVMLEVLTGKRVYFSKEEREEEEKEERVEEEKTKEDWHKWQKLDGFGHHSLVSFALPLIEAGEVWKVLDRRPAADPTPRQLEAAELVAQTAARCLRLQVEDRPPISEIVASLEKALELARCDG